MRKETNSQGERETKKDLPENNFRREEERERRQRGRKGYLRKKTEI